MIIGVVAGGLVLVLLGLAAVWTMIIAPPQKVVLDFLAALQAGDAQRALALSTTPRRDARMLTDAVLAKNNEIAPITDVRYIRTDYNKVTVSYRMGERPITETYLVERAGAWWKLYSGVVSFSAGTRVEAAFRMNGFEVSGNLPDMFPGVYTLEQDNPLLGFPEKELVITAGSTNSFNPQAFNITYNSDGERAMRAELTAQLSKCTASKSVEPRNCRFVYEPPPAAQVDTETIRWTLLDDPVGSWQPVDAGNLAEVSGAILYRAEFSATVTLYGRRMQVRRTSVVAMNPTFDLTSGKAILTAW